ncbi:MAG: hypothetical protein JWL77_2329 [Chthonomonadaceae bacterium]|nr:hypothetical protein [Chthonomonadaceae bacterium]
MKVVLTKVLALGGLCALLVGAGNTAFAQGYDRYDHHDMGYDHRDMGRDNRSIVFGTRQRIQELQRSYARNMRMGNYEAARRAHLQAEALRSRLRDRRDFGG